MSYTKEEIKIEEQKLLALRRAARCVIALEGLSDDALDGGWNFEGIAAYVCQLLRERDNLRRQLLREHDNLRRQLEVIRKLLSDGEIENLSKGNRYPSSFQKIKEFVRAIEKAHGLEKQPYGECHLKPNEVCCICGSVNSETIKGEIDEQ